MKPIIIANWKMQLRLNTSVLLARALVPVMAASNDAYSLVVCPSFVSLPGVANEIAHSRISLGAQDVGTVTQGARTGDVSVLDLYSLGCTHCIVGHSERRVYHGERDEDVRDKVTACLRTGLIPVVCVGETAAERAKQQTHAIVVRQLRAALGGIPVGPRTQVMIAYEPVWSISPGTPANHEQVEEVSSQIRGEVKELGVPESAATILYGGSVNVSTAQGFLHHTSVDGFLVGSESQDEKRFISLLNVFRDHV